MLARLPEARLLRKWKQLLTDQWAQQVQISADSRALVPQAWPLAATPGPPHPFKPQLTQGEQRRSTGLGV